jgi:hypothetical protein
MKVIFKIILWGTLILLLVWTASAAKGGMALVDVLSVLSGLGGIWTLILWMTGNDSSAREISV